MRKSPNFLRVFAFLFILVFSGGAFAAGYDCPFKYTSCASGHYMTASGTSSACDTSMNVGNACRDCSVMGGNYTCAGGTTCPLANAIARTCAAGTYWDGAGCVTCTAGNYCPGFTNVDDPVAGYGLTACYSGYDDGGTGLSAANQCAIHCDAGARVMTTDGPCVNSNGSWYTSGHNVSLGQTSATIGAVGYCATGYATPNTLNPTDHDSVADCATYCNPGTTVVATDEQCSACPFGQTNTGGTVTQGGTGPACTNIVVTCSAGEYLPANSTACTTCPVGNYCGGGTYTFNSASNQGINACASGYTTSGTGASAQGDCAISCAAGTRVQSINGLCETSGGSWYTAAHSVSSGQTSATAGHVNSCATGYATPNTTTATDHDSLGDCVTYCGPDTTVETANTQCVSCPFGKTNVGGTVSQGGTGPTCYNIVVTCSAGEYLPVNQTNCSPCPGGWYCIGGEYTFSATVNQGVNTCPAGYDDGGAGAASMNECAIACATDTTVALSTAQCTACPVGTFNAGGTTPYGQTGPTCGTASYTCAPGQYLPANATVCATCTGGDYCPGGTYYFDAVLAQGQISCPNGGDTSAGAGTIGECFKVNMLCTVPNGSGLNTCYYTSGIGAGAIYDTGCTTCSVTDCAPGFEHSGNSCPACPAGSFCEGDGTATSCASVGDGTWNQSSTGSSNQGACYKTCPNLTLTGGIATSDNPIEFYPTPCRYSGCTLTGGEIGIISDGSCVPATCAGTHELVNGICQPCDRTNALSYKTTGNCEIATCVAGWHPEGQQCVENVIGCTAPNADDARRTWDFTLSAFGTCKIVTCANGYHLASNACIADEQACTIANGTGMREWDHVRNKWKDCVATACNPGYTDDSSETNELSKPCGVCRNKFSVLGEIAVSSYTTGCEIASCMYQGEMYNLDGNECVPICDVAGYSDETGTMRWNAPTKKCVRQCNDGYTMW